MVYNVESFAQIDPNNTSKEARPNLCNLCNFDKDGFTGVVSTKTRLAFVQ